MALLQDPIPKLEPMDQERMRRVSTLVDSTFDLSLKELRSFLDRECPDDPELRAEVERRVLDRSTITGLPAPALRRYAPALSTGEVIADRYRITRLIGRGGMGEVYEAHDLLLKEDVALKTLRADLAGDEALLERFHKEISITRKVTHPNVCRIFEVGIHRTAGQPVLFFAMELLRGHTLAERIGAGRLPRDEAFPIAVQLAEGLQAAHRAGIVHADFKSANVILVKSRGATRAVITDFGVARLDPGNASLDEARAPVDTVRVAGTLPYMSPEQLAGDRVTAASDIYSFGIVLYEMACGERPFDEMDLIKAAMLRAGGPPPSVRTKVPHLDERWESAIARCLQRDPDRRFRSASELATWFRDGEWWNVGRWTRHDKVLTSVAAVMVLAAAIGGWTWSHRTYQPLPEAQRWYERGMNALYSMTYETARKALEQSIAIDPTFALAHASLARAYDELDYSDRAKDSMLRAVAAAQESRLTQDDDRKLRALQFMVSRDYPRAAPIVKQIEAEARAGDRATAALESGWLAQQMEDSDGAAAAFGRALVLDPSNAAARLRLGFIFGRQAGKDDQALAAFGQAERLYRMSGNVEGVTQTMLECANLLDRRNRENEALPVIAEAVTMARAVGNRYQEVRLRFIEATTVRDLGDVDGATTIVQHGIDTALAENMDNLAANGQIDLGNIFLRANRFDRAEPLFRRALDIARRAKVRRIEARAQGALGALLEQVRRPAEAKPLVEAALTFYRQAGYRRESVQAATILGGLHQQLGDSQEGIRVLTDALPQAIRLQDRRLEAQLRERLADCLADRGDVPRAVAEYEHASQLYGSTAPAQAASLKAEQLRARMTTSPQH